MKRVRWRNDVLEWDRGNLSVLRSDTSELFEVEGSLGEEWREIQSAEYVPETGRFKLVLKPVVPKVPTLLEAAKNLINTNLYGMNEVQYAALNELHKAVHREEASPAKPPKYTDEAVDEFLDAVLVRNRNGTPFDLVWLNEPVDSLVESGSRELWSAFHTLLKQRNA